MGEIEKAMLTLKHYYYKKGNKADKLLVNILHERSLQLGIQVIRVMWGDLTYPLHSWLMYLLTIMRPCTSRCIRRSKPVQRIYMAA